MRYASLTIVWLPSVTIHCYHKTVDYGPCKEFTAFGVLLHSYWHLTQWDGQYAEDSLKFWKQSPAMLVEPHCFPGSVMLLFWCSMVMGLDLDPTTYWCGSLGKSCDFLSLSLLICIMSSLGKVNKWADIKNQHTVGGSENFVLSFSTSLLSFFRRPLSVSLGVHVMQLADKSVK